MPKAFGFVGVMNENDNEKNYMGAITHTKNIWFYKPFKN